MKQILTFIFNVLLLVLLAGPPLMAQQGPMNEDGSRDASGSGDTLRTDKSMPPADSINTAMDSLITESNDPVADSIVQMEDTLQQMSDTTTRVADTSVLPTDSLARADTIHIPLIRRIEIYVDYLKFVSFALPNELKGEAGLAIITRPNIGLHIEAGYGAKMPENHYKNADYSVSGYYGRIGLFYHYPYDPGTNFYIGANYGRSFYTDEATWYVESSLWDDYEDSFSRSGMEGQWVEAVAGSESSFRGRFYLGFQFRFRVLISHDNFQEYKVFAIPGYGRTMDKSVPALNLYIKYMIPFD